MLANTGNLMTKEEMIGFFGQSCSLECHCLLSASEESSGLNRNHDALGLSELPLTQVEM